ncbi:MULTISPECIES: hypothetical protein [Streptomyces]|uniref:Uncharacterized protein n=2 Tax=Streptomyces TaxID=1883 RepID=A0ABU4KA85_9ACTN|nr:hypothetical protein [Streptomyces roseolus]MDX2294688.1 hypothetical protein [Streptomyces roseolus]
MSTFKPTGSDFRRCVVCGNPVSPKKLVLVRDGRPAHRACRPVTGVPVRLAAARAAAAAAAAPKPAKPMSRAEMLRRIDELRRRDARKKAASAKKAAPAKKAAADKKAAGKKAAGLARKPPAPGARSSRPQPYYGVEMKSVGGTWVQMHPESE